MHCPADSTAIPNPYHLVPYLNPDWFYRSGAAHSFRVYYWSRWIGPTFPYLESLILITEDGECTTEFRTRLNSGQAIGASLKKIWKSHSIPISTKIRLMKALVWPVATYSCKKLDSQKKMKKHVLTPLR